MTSHDPSCIFCKIVAAQIPAHVIHEDRSTLAFLDIGPLAEGHLLIIPRIHAAKLSDLPAEVAGDLGTQLPHLGRALMKVVSVSAYNVLCNEGEAAGQAVRHVHFHLIPRKSGDQLGYRWNAGAYSGNRASELAARFQEVLASK